MANGESIAVPAPLPETLRDTPVDQTNRLPASATRGARFSPAKLFADHAFAARVWFFVACGALAFCIIQPYLIIKAYRTRERVVVLDGAGSFSISPLLGFEEAKDLHESMALWATLALFQRNPRNFDYPDMLQKMFLADAHSKATTAREKSQPEFETKQIHQKPEVFKIDFLRTREDRVLVKVEGQLVRAGAFENQTFTESPKFTLTLTFARNPDMLTNKRYPLGVWSYEATVY
ncbi:MAG: hypothetical protein Q8N18_26005 [Opitutaceae bacterium]|nr:hypothetical protein [Opitutaceae bacterium]